MRSIQNYNELYGQSYCQSEDAVEQLQMVLDNLNTEEAPIRGRDTSSNSKHFFLMHGCKSLAQEKMKLQLKSETKEEYNDEMGQETIDVQRMNDKLNYLQRVVPKITSKKPIHDLLRPIKDIKKLMDKAISNGALVGNHTSQDDMKNSTSIEIKLLTKLIRDLEKEKEKGETTNILQGKRKIDKGYTEKMRHLQEKIQCIDKERDAEKKYILDLKKSFNSRHKTACFTTKKGTSEI
ncbi:hypothetical protein AALP_AA5G179500 [Arabis alpina]|uniref:Uncharacterized protein n=1 Tax=Arabis alpina TaxID=50452 RepID=A0A087GXU2_ARAAL|nr:hypothetical protein AALP_AA5G179500 [Arabis alpina]